MAYTHELVANCLQFERAFCTAECPFQLDVRDFIGKLQQGRFNIAYKTYQQVVGFPGIVTALCPEPCKLVCPLKDAGGAISLKLLEKAAMAYARSTVPDQYNLPPKEKQIAIIGAGISGLACALRLTNRKYQVTVYEKSDRIGGHLHDVLAPDIFLEDIQRQFTHESYTLHLNTEILQLDDLHYDAIFVATGKVGNDFGLAKNVEGAFATTTPGVFWGGSLTGADTMQAIADGLNVSNAIERYVKIGKMNQPEESSETKLRPDVIRITPSAAVLPQNGQAFTKDEAVAEAKRCLKCTCDACHYYSPLMGYFDKFPKRITEEVHVTLHPSSLDGHATLATRLMSTCLHCGLCKEVCPENIDTGEFLLQSHRTMRAQGKMPWAFHEFYLRDMAFSNQEAGLTKIPTGYTTSQYVFFPGCQLGASDPRLVLRSYQFLIEHFPDTALMLHCCGTPADWAGDEPIHRNVLEKITTAWKNLGKPTAIFACPMCKQMFQTYLPEIQGQFLYQMIEAKGMQPITQFTAETASVFDPCASRYEPALQQTIRQLAANAGFKLEPLPMEGKMAECCSYGGQVTIAHPPYANHIVQKRISQNTHPYITYCSNCRDIFAKSGKRTWHILDVIFGLDNENRVQPTVSERRNNRLHLKQQILKEFWNETDMMEQPEKTLILSPELKEKFNKELILESDLRAVIEHCEQSGRKLFDPEKETFTGHRQIGNMTYWVEYRMKPDDQLEILNGYCHRMKIEE